MMLNKRQREFRKMMKKVEEKHSGKIDVYSCREQ